MAVRLRWRGVSFLAAALVLLSACSSVTTTHAITGTAATTGPIVVTTNLASYTTGDAVGATVTNSSKSDFYTQDGKSACTIVQLEKYDTNTGAWVHVDRCNGSQATQVLMIAQNSSVPFTLAPTSDSDVNSWDPGTYRVAVSYSSAVDGATGVQEAHSAAFTING